MYYEASSSLHMRSLTKRQIYILEDVNLLQQCCKRLNDSDIKVVSWVKLKFTGKNENMKFW